MGIETFNYIDSLDTANPTATDNVSEGDDHLRGIKTTLKNSFPNINAAVTATDEELNFTDGVTSNIQTQIDGKTTESFVNTAVSDLVDSSPAALNTLNELAAALGDDANYAATVTTNLAGKVDDSQVLTNVPSGALFTDTTYSIGDGGLTQKNFTTTLNSKLDGIAAGANVGDAAGTAVAMAIALGG